MWLRLFIIPLFIGFSIFLLLDILISKKEAPKSHHALNFEFSLNTLIVPYENEYSFTGMEKNNGVTDFFYEDNEALVFTKISITHDESTHAEQKTILVYLNHKNFRLDSIFSMRLKQGGYQFYVLFEYKGFQYAAKTSYQITTGDNIVHFSIYPVLGETLINIQEVNKLAIYKPSYFTLNNHALMGKQLGIKRLEHNKRMFTIKNIQVDAQAYISLSHLSRENIARAHLARPHGSNPANPSNPIADNRQGTDTKQP